MFFGGPTVLLRILTAARAHAGLLSAATVALDLGLSLDEAQSALELVERSGACTGVLDPSGAILYTFTLELR